jgi:hypothetical protein
MGKSKISLTGVPEKEFTVNEDGTVDLLFKLAMSETVPRGLSPLGKTIYLVKVGPKAWNNISPKPSKDSFFIIQGEPKAVINKKGVPFIKVICFDISIRENTKDTNSIRPIADSVDLPKKQTEPSKPPKTLKNRSVLPTQWYLPVVDQLVNIKVDDIVLTETIHLNAKYVNINGLNKTISKGFTSAAVAVRKIDNDKYSLIAGLKVFTQCKLGDIKTVKAYITDLNHYEFINKFNIFKK